MVIRVVYLGWIAGHSNHVLITRHYMRTALLASTPVEEIIARAGAEMVVQLVTDLGYWDFDTTLGADKIKTIIDLLSLEQLETLTNKEAKRIEPLLKELSL